MNIDEVKKQLRLIVAEILEIDECELDEQALFKDEYDADSITSLEVLASIESDMGVQLAEDVAEHFTSMNNIYSVVLPHLYKVDAE
jgi:acyl carrier protein